MTSSATVPFSALYLKFGSDESMEQLCLSLSYSMLMSESNWECHKHSFKSGRVEQGATALVQTSKGNHVCHKDVIALVMSIIC